MRKIILKSFSLVLVVCMLMSLVVVTASAESTTVDIALSEAALVDHNASNFKVEGVTYAGNMAGSGVAGNTYALQEISNSTSRKLYLRFDLTQYSNWDITNAILSFNLKNENSSQSSIAIYKADEVSGNLSDIPTTYAGNISGLTGIVKDSNLLDSFTFKKSAGSNYLSSPGLTVERNLSQYIAGRILAGETSATFLVVFQPNQSIKDYIAYVGAKDTSFAPKLTITGEERIVVEEEPDSYTQEASDAILISLKNNTLSTAEVTRNASDINGAGVSANAYGISDALSGHTATTDVKRLYLKFDLSDYTNWDVTGANLSMNIKNTNGTASTVAIYKADTITGALSDIPADYANNISGLTGIATEGNKIDSFTVRNKKEGADYITNPGVLVERDITNYITSSIANGKHLATVVIELHAGVDSNAYIAYIGALGTAYAPKLTVEGTPKHVFKTSVSSSPASVGIVSADNEGNITAGRIKEAEHMPAEEINMNAYWLTDTLGEHSATVSHDRLFLTFDLGNITSFESAEFVMFLKNSNTSESKVKVYKADGIDGNAGNITTNYSNVNTLLNDVGNNLIKEIAVRKSTGYTYGVEEVVDVTSYIKKCIADGKTSATIMIQFEAGLDNKAYVAYIGAEGSYAPVLRLTNNGLPTSGIAGTKDKITATYISFIGEDSPIDAKAYSAIYDGTDENRMISCGVSETYTFDGNGSKIVLDMAVPAGADYSELFAKFFLWDEELTPYYEFSDLYCE